MFNAETDLQKWAPVLEHADAPAFQDSHRKAVTAKLLENTETAIRQEGAQNSFLTENNVTAGGTLTNYDPILISLVRRAMPNLVAFDVAGVQPMTGPTGLIFAMKSRYNDKTSSPSLTKVGKDDPEALGLDEPDTAFSGQANTDHAGVDGEGVSRETGEGAFFNDMGFTLEKTTVTAKTRGLKAEYTMELAQDLKAVHGLDAESELANILSTEILAEMNREIIQSINAIAKPGFSDNNNDSPINSVFDLATDADGRWAVEKFKSLIFQLEVEANAIAKDTRRGKGNYLLCSANVASALAAAGSLDHAAVNGLQVDATGNTFAGVLNGRIKVYVDPYAVTDYATIGYKGTSAYDAGLFYCPYVPLTMVRAVDENTFQPKIGFKTRYGLQQNPFVGEAAGIGAVGSNPYFRKFTIDNINVAG